MVKVTEGGPMRFEGVVAVVTGAAGGIGQAICAQLRGEGARVAGLDVRACPGTDRSIICDVGNDAAVASAAQEVGAHLGEASVLVHAAALSENRPTLESSTDAFAHLYNVNVISAVRLVLQFVPAMRAARRGSIVFVSSINGAMGAPGLAAYAASKGGLDALLRSLALELAPSGVRVNGVAPASIDTPLLQASFDRHADPAAARAANVKRHPLDRLGTPEDVAKLVAFLASDEASWVTGAIYALDGGAHLARR
jgi:2-keto-3-deoxy-L-fuconate dehydrogenase